MLDSITLKDLIQFMCIFFAILLPATFANLDGRLFSASRDEDKLCWKHQHPICLRCSVQETGAFRHAETLNAFSFTAVFPYQLEPMQNTLDSLLQNNNVSAMTLVVLLERWMWAFYTPSNKAECLRYVQTSRQLTGRLDRKIGHDPAAVFQPIFSIAYHSSSESNLDRSKTCVLGVFSVYNNGSIKFSASRC